jgi:hypothetical protein
MADRAAVSRRSGVAAALAAAATAVLAACGGQSGAESPAREQVSAVARAYSHAFLTRDGKRMCALMTRSLRRQLIAPAGARMPRPSSCAETLAFAAGTVRASSVVRPVLSAVRVDGTRATATFRSSSGVAVLPLALEGGNWRVDGTVHYTSRVWLKTDYRIRSSGGASASAVARVLEERARAIIGTDAQTRGLGAGEVSLSVAQSVRPADLALVARSSGGRLAFYDWEAEALTPAGRPVADGLPHLDPTSVLISQGSGSNPGTGPGSMTRRDAIKLAGRQRPRGWAVVRAWAPIPGAGPDAPQYYVLRDRPALSGADIQFAYADTDPLGNPSIVLDLTPRGVRRFQDLTAEVAHRGAALDSPDLLDQHIAAVLDGHLLSVPFIDSRAHPDGISAEHGAQITGDFSPSTAQQLAAEIAAPPLPATLQEIDSTTFTKRGG